MKSDTRIGIGKVKIKRFNAYSIALLILAAFFGILGVTTSTKVEKQVILRDQELSEMKQQIKKEMNALAAISPKQIEAYAKYQVRLEKEILTKYPTDNEISMKSRTYYGLCAMFILYAGVLSLHSYQRKRTLHLRQSFY